MSGIDYQQIAVNAAVAAQKRGQSANGGERQFDVEVATAARFRGDQIRTIAHRVASQLQAKGRLPVRFTELERELISVLADELYPGVAVDL